MQFRNPSDSSSIKTGVSCYMNYDYIKQLRRERDGHEFGDKIYLLNKIGSTQNHARSLVRKGIKPLHGTIIIAREQLRGIGRLDRRWISPAGGLWMSIIMKRALTTKRTPIIQFLSALSVGESIFEMTGLQCRYKWPNDILVQGKKICGILLEADFIGNKIKTVIIGIGVNANFPASNIFQSKNLVLHTEVTTLRDELGYDVSLFGLVNLILEKLEHYYGLLKKDKIKEIMDLWKHGSEPFDRIVTIRDGKDTFQARTLGVDNKGILKVELSNGSVKEVIFGDVDFNVVTKVRTKSVIR